MLKYLRLSAFVLFASLWGAASAQNILINEIVAVNVTGVCDTFDNHSDWIEIYNPNSYSINLYNYKLSDDDQNASKWHFPNVNIASKGYLVIFASEDESVGEQLHANFKLAKEGESLSLYDPSGRMVDHLAPVELRGDVSYGRPDGGSGELQYFAVPTPGAANVYAGYTGFVDAEVSFSIPSGYYSESQTVEASTQGNSGVLRYTLDGSAPTEDSPIFSSALTLRDVSSAENFYSMIKTNPSFDFPQAGFDEKRANTRGWLPPYSTIAKTNVINVSVFEEGLIPSEPQSMTYFIYPEGANKYSLPVVSLITEGDNLFDDEKGIYVYGTTGAEGNYKEGGLEWERPVLFQYFENDGSFAFEQDLGLRIHGGGGRHSTVKNLRLYAREEYGKDEVKYNFFDDDENATFKSFMLRGPGHRPDCAPRDDLADLLLQNQDMDLQHVNHVVVFVNGEYWGVHTIKERFDQKYLEEKYGKDNDDYVIMRNRGTLDKGEEGDDQHYYNILDYCESNDLSNDRNYDYVKTQIDIDNYLSYLAAEIFMGNVDWVITNIKFWRYKGEEGNTATNNALDGKWRWFMFDFDLVFGGSCSDISPNVNIMDDVFDPALGEATILARNLKLNPQFEYDFVNRLCDQMNSLFSTTNFRKRLFEIDSIMTPEMLEHTDRWRYPSQDSSLLERANEVPSLAQWDFIIDSLYNYPKSRKRKVIDHLNQQFDLSDTASLQLDVNDRSMGCVHVNSLEINAELDGVSSSVYPWSGMYFQNTPLTLYAEPSLGYRFVKWLESSDPRDALTISLDSDSSFTAVFEVDPDYTTDEPLCINEFMASNNSNFVDEYQNNADWIEIYNPNDVAVDLGGYFISDDVTSPFKYRFDVHQSETVVEPNDFLIIWCDDNTERGVLHTNFKLSAAGEDVIMLSPDSIMVDKVQFGQQGDGVSYGREVDGGEDWIFFADLLRATPNESNANAVGVVTPVVKTMNLYPNPVSQGKMVYFSRSLSFKLYNAFGQEVLSRENVHGFESSSLASGVYFIFAEGYGTTKLLVE